MCKHGSSLLRNQNCIQYSGNECVPICTVSVFIVCWNFNFTWAYTATSYIETRWCNCQHQLRFIKMLHGLLISYPNFYSVFLAIDYLNVPSVTEYSSYKIINTSKGCVVCTRFYVKRVSWNSQHISWTLVLWRLCLTNS